MMKKIAIISAIFLLWTGGISFSQETCGLGKAEGHMEIGKKLVLCWTKSADATEGYRVYKSVVSNEKGTDVAVTVQGECDVTFCDSQPIAMDELGTFFFKVYAFSNPALIQYEKYNPETKQMEPAEYIKPGYESLASNEVVVHVVEAADKPDKPSGCSIRRIF